MKQKVSRSGVALFFRRAMFVLSIAFVSGGAVFLVQRGKADSITGSAAFQAADMGSRLVLENMKRLNKNDAIAKLSGQCSDGTLSGENSSGEYRVMFRDSNDRPMECSERIEDVAAIETTGIFGSEKRVVRVALAQSTTSTGDSTNYVTTGSESQYKKGALGIGGLLKAYLGINANDQRITNVASPVNSSDAATKAYVDAQGGGNGGGGSGGGGGCTPSGACRYGGIRTDAASFGAITMREGTGCKECHPESSGNKDTNCPWFNSCADITASGYRCITSEVTGGESSGERTSATSIGFMCTCYKN